MFFLFIITQKTNAQTDTSNVDSNYVDTVSITNIDSSTAEYNDEDDGYVDTTVKHIYDTSQYFFNRKEYYDDAYTREKITQRNLINSNVNKLKSEDDFWYVTEVEKMETRLQNDPKFRDSLMKEKNHELTDKSKNDLMYQPWFNTLLWCIIIAIFAAAVIYFLIQNKISLFQRESASSGEANDDNNNEDVFHLSYTKLIQSAEKENDYRVAVRLMFLQTLKLLSDTNKIQYQPDYTNLDYLQQLHETKFYTEFFKVMRSYEYIWYGKFYISTGHYTTIKNDFIKLQHTII